MILIGKLLDGNDAYRWIADALSNVEQPIDLCSAFLRSEALSALLHSAPKSLSGRILVRWRLIDLIAGASDFEAYDIAVSRGFEVYMRLDFHGKLYSLPPHGVMVGSANATLSGLGLTSASNVEICTLAPSDSDSRRVIDGLYTDAVLVNAHLMSLLQGAYQQCEKSVSLEHEWPSSVLAVLFKPRTNSSLFVDECFWGSPDWLTDSSIALGANAKHDQTLLGIFSGASVDGLSKKVLKRCVQQSAFYQWLVATIKKNNGEIYFGQLSASLHDILADDPSPSRQNVKTFIQNLLNWVSLLNMDEILIDRPRYSQRIRLSGSD